MNTIKCSNCGEEIEVDKALEGQIEARVLAAEHKKHEAELVKVRAEADENAQKAAEIAILNALGQLKDACNGDLNKVKSCICISVYVHIYIRMCVCEYRAHHIHTTHAFGT